MSKDEEVWRGEESPPAELAGEIERVPSSVLRLRHVEPLETVTIQCSAANRDLIVRALRAMPLQDHGAKMHELLTIAVMDFEAENGRVLTNPNHWTTQARAII